MQNWWLRIEETVMIARLISKVHCYLFCFLTSTWFLLAKPTLNLLSFSLIQLVLPSYHLLHFFLPLFFFPQICTSFLIILTFPLFFSPTYLLLFSFLLVLLSRDWRSWHGKVAHLVIQCHIDQPPHLLIFCLQFLLSLFLWKKKWGTIPTTGGIQGEKIWMLLVNCRIMISCLVTSS